MKIEQCVNLLEQTAKQNPALLDKVSILTAKARGIDKQSCLASLDGMENVYSLVNKYKQTITVPAQENPLTDPVVIEKKSQNFFQYLLGIDPNQNTLTVHPAAELTGVVATGAIQQPSLGETSYESPLGRLIIGAEILLGTFLIVVLFRWLKQLGEVMYDITNSSRMVYLKVILPRSDSKNDREREKEVAKDMKEKIGRMSQVFKGVHKLGELSVTESIMNFFFRKAKMSFIMQYEEGVVNFIVATYPEYQHALEGAISAQYSESTIEVTTKPNFFDHKYVDVIPLQPKKDPIFPIKLFKQFEDDPMNNIVDAMGKISTEDSFHIVLTIKPAGHWFNKKALQWSEGLYRNDSDYASPKSFLSKINPFRIIGFMFRGPKKEGQQNTDKLQEGGKDFVRMTKPKEDALNAMAEEASKSAFVSSLIIAGSSDDEGRLGESIRNLLGAYSIYKDEFNNELDHNQFLTDTFGWLFEPMWRIALNNHLIKFFFKRNVFTENALTSLWHLPDSVFNRSPVIKWMDYKVIDAPDNLPVLKEPNGYIFTGTIAEKYLGGDLSKIYANSNNWALGWGTEDIEKFVDFDEKIHAGVKEDQIIEKDGKKVVKSVEKKQKFGLKAFKDGVLLGVNVYRNQFTPVYMSRKDRSRHHYIIGKSGGGKSVLLNFLARQDAWNGDGFCVIDPHGDLVEDILQYIPPSRARDVVYFDAGDEARPMGLNLYDIDNMDQADRVVNDATEMFLKMFGPEVFGPRLQEYFKFGSLTLLEDLEEGATLLDIPRLFTDESFREYKVAKVKNPMVRNFWDRTYASIGDREKEEIIPYLTAKFVSFTTNSLIRNIIGQTESAFNFRQIMDEGKILLVNLSKGRIGELNAQLLGMIFVSQINNGAMSRADIEESKRRDFYLYVDEFQNFVTNTFADILSEARKYHLALIMAHQYIAQLDGGASNNIGESSGGKKSVKDAVFGNVGTMQSFKIGAIDAEFLEKEYAPVLSAQDIIGISNYKTYTKLNITNATSRVFSIDSLWSQDYKSKRVADVLKEVCAMKFGRAKEFVEAEIQARIGIMPNDPVTDSVDTESQTPVDNAQDSNQQSTVDIDTTQNIDSQTIENQEISGNESVIDDQNPVEESSLPVSEEVAEESLLSDPIQLQDESGKPQVENIDSVGEDDSEEPVAAPEVASDDLEAVSQDVVDITDGDEQTSDEEVVSNKSGEEATEDKPKAPVLNDPSSL